MRVKKIIVVIVLAILLTSCSNANIKGPANLAGPDILTAFSSSEVSDNKNTLEEDDNASPESNSSAVLNNPNKGKGKMSYTLEGTDKSLVMSDVVQINSTEDSILFYLSKVSSVNHVHYKTNIMDFTMARKNLENKKAIDSLITIPAYSKNIEISSTMTKPTKNDSELQITIVGSYLLNEVSFEFETEVYINKSGITGITYNAVKGTLPTLKTAITLTESTLLDINIKKAEHTSIVTSEYQQLARLDKKSVGVITGVTSEYIKDMFGNSAVLKGQFVFKDLYNRGIAWGVYLPFKTHFKVNADVLTTVSVSSDAVDISEYNTVSVSYSIKEATSGLASDSISDENIYGFSEIVNTIYKPIEDYIIGNKCKVISENKYVNAQSWSKEVVYEDVDLKTEHRYVKTVSIFIKKEVNSDYKVSVLSFTDKANKDDVKLFKLAFEKSVK